MKPANTNKPMKNRYITAFPTLNYGALNKSTKGEPRDYGSGDEAVRFLSSGRSAVFHAVRQFKIKKPWKVLVPSYHCGVEIQAILDAGAEIKYYPVQHDMQILLANILPLLNAEIKALFLIHYWGFSHESIKIAEVCREKHVLLIEDCAHALFSGCCGMLGKIVGDACVYSLPKTLPVPDGGLLRFRERADSLGNIKKGATWPAVKGAARLVLENLRSSHTRRNARLAEYLLTARQKTQARARNGWNVRAQTELNEYQQGISSLSKYLFLRSSARTIVSRRRRNYLCLVELLELEREVEIVFTKLHDDVCPLFCPVLVRNGQRDGLEQHLKEKQIETFVFGRKPHGTLRSEEYPDAEILSKQVLGLPIHQGLCEADMKTIATETLEWAKASTV